MEELKRTPLFERHVAAGAMMVDFGGWEMPMQYPTGIVEEHLYTRKYAGLFDVSHMGRFWITGAEAVPFLQRVLSSNVASLAVNRALYAIIPTETGGAVDDAYLYRFDEAGYMLVVNASNTEKDWVHLTNEAKNFDVALADRTKDLSLISLQGPQSRAMLEELSGSTEMTDDKKNALGVVKLKGLQVGVSKTGYTGEPIGYEIFCRTEDAVAIWDMLVEKGARPTGLGARDTLRLEAGYPLYGHEMGKDEDGKEIPIFAVPLAKFAVNFSEEKGAFIGREVLEQQLKTYTRIIAKDFSDLALVPRRIRSIVLTGRGVMRAGCPVYVGEKKVGTITSATSVPYYVLKGEDDAIEMEERAKRSIGLVLIDSDIGEGATVHVDIRGKKVAAAIVKTHLKANQPPYARPIIFEA